MNVVGLFRELDCEMSPALDSIHDLLGKLSVDKVAMVVAYLRGGTPVFDVMGVSTDPLDRRFVFSGGPSLLSDGQWVWRADAYYFVEKYRIRLPNDFVEHVVAAGGVPADMSDEIVRIGEDVVASYESATKLGNP